MGGQKAELRFIVESNKHGSTLIVISNSPGIIEDIQHSIDAFCKRQTNLYIVKGHAQYVMNAKAFLDIQNIIYDILQ